MALQDYRFFPKPHLPPRFPSSLLRNALPIRISAQKTRFFSRISPPLCYHSPRKIPTSFKINVSVPNTSPFSRIPASALRFGKRMPSPPATSPDRQVFTQKTASFARILTLSHNFALISAVFLPFSSHAAAGEQVSQKINTEQVLTSIDDFFNRNPFFVAGVTVFWLVVIPLTQEYFKKYKFISAIDAFRKLRDMPNAQLLDVRKRRSVKFMAPPSLKILNKNVVLVEYSEGNEQGFLKEVLQNFEDPQNTVICVLDNFDGDSLKLAELLYKNGFKEAYAIKGGLRGNNGWQQIQETYLPPSVHVRPRQKSRQSAETEVNDQIMNEQGKVNGPTLKNLNAGNGSAMKTNPGRPLSPYPNYPDLKPPSSPSPSKPSN